MKLTNKFITILILIVFLISITLSSTIMYITEFYMKYGDNLRDVLELIALINLLLFIIMAALIGYKINFKIGRF